MSIDLYSSVAGIRAFFKKMDVTAHNVANINTDGYKRRIPHIQEDKNGLPDTIVTIDSTPGIEYPERAGRAGELPREMSNVNYAEEAINMMEVKSVAGRMFGSLLDIFT